MGEMDKIITFYKVHYLSSKLYFFFLKIFASFSTIYLNNEKSIFKISESTQEKQRAWKEVLQI
jgi:hypothetical protein